MKRNLNRKAFTAFLVVVLAFVSGAFADKADAYSLNKPTSNLEEFTNYSGVKIFINGRLVEFNDSLGYPYINNEGRTMIPLRTVAETFGANVSYNGYLRVATVSRFGKEVQTQIDNKKMVFTNMNEHPWITEVFYNDVPTVIKNDRTYVPLRAVFELFGMAVRWDQNTKTAHIELPDDFKNIDFRGERVISIKDLDASHVNKITYDGVECDKAYINILKNSDQYKVIIINDEAVIFSYQMLYNLDYFYGKAKEAKKSYFNIDDYVILSNITREELNFTADMTNITDFRSSCGWSGDDGVYSFHWGAGSSEKEYKEALEIAQRIAAEVKSETPIRREQIILAVHKLCDLVTYEEDPYRMDADAYDALIEHKGVCSAYQAAFDLIMKQLEIPSLTVSGTVGGVGHARGRVYVDGQWKTVDATWADGYNGHYNDSWILFEEDNIQGNAFKVRDDYKEDIELLQLTYKFD